MVKDSHRAFAVSKSTDIYLKKARNYRNLHIKNIKIYWYSRYSKLELDYQIFTREIKNELPDLIH